MNQGTKRTGVDSEADAIAEMARVGRERAEQWEGVAHRAAMGGERPRSFAMAEGAKGKAQRRCCRSIAHRSRRRKCCASGFCQAATGAARGVQMVGSVSRSGPSLLGEKMLPPRTTDSTHASLASNPK